MVATDVSMVTLDVYCLFFSFLFCFAVRFFNLPYRQHTQCPSWHSPLCATPKSCPSTRNCASKCPAFFSAPWVPYTPLTHPQPHHSRFSQNTLLCHLLAPFPPLSLSLSLSISLYLSFCLSPSLSITFSLFPSPSLYLSLSLLLSTFSSSIHVFIFLLSPYCLSLFLSFSTFYAFILFS